MKQSKAILLIFISLMLVALTSTLVSAQDDYNWESDYSTDPSAPWILGGLAGAFCIIPIVAIIISIVIAIWVYKDAEKRGSSGALWLIICIFTGIIGLIIWLIVRPPIGGKQEQTGASQRRCPGCGRVIPDDAQVCPYCGREF